MKRILISGEGGQGVQLLAKCLVEAAYYSGSKISYVPNYGVEQRGGVSLGFVQISDREIGFPKFQNADILVILAERAVERVKEYVTEKTLIVYDVELVSEIILKGINAKKIPIEAKKIAEEKLTGKVMNIVVLGCLAKIVGGIDEKELARALAENLAGKYKEHPELKHFNERALEFGMLVNEKVQV